MKKIIILFLVTIIFAADTTFAFAKMLENLGEKKINQKREEKIQARVREMSTKLVLDNDQRQKITDILTKAKEETMKLLHETGEKIEQLKVGSELEIEAVLTQKQKEKIDEVAEEDEEDKELLKIFRGY